jgi:cbb3-type cytochrome oxidase subunit 3
MQYMGHGGSIILRGFVLIIFFLIIFIFIYLFIYWDTNRKENPLQNQGKRRSQQLNQEILSCFVQVRKKYCMYFPNIQVGTCWKIFWHVAEV